MKQLNSDNSIYHCNKHLIINRKMKSQKDLNHRSKYTNLVHQAQLDKKELN